MLSTVDVADFLYTCETHLSDPGFATEVSDPETSKPRVSVEEIEKIKREYDEKQKSKKAATPTIGTSESKKNGSEESASASQPSPGGSGSASTALAEGRQSHRRFTLHRQYFAMRQDVHRRKENMAKLKEVAPKLPRAPTSRLP